MRSSIEFYVSGETISQVTEKVITEWKRIPEDEDATLPLGAEVRMLASTENDKRYMAYVIVKTKIEE